MNKFGWFVAGAAVGVGGVLVYQNVVEPKLEEMCQRKDFDNFDDDFDDESTKGSDSATGKGDQV